MRRIKLHLCEETTSGWEYAVRLMVEYLAENLKANLLLDQLPSTLVGQRRALCQSLFLGALREGHKIRAAVKPFLRKKPKPRVEAIFLIAGYELTSSPLEKGPKIIHHAVENSKKLLVKAEFSFLNAVLRKLPEALAAAKAESAPLHSRHSHPEWLVQRWVKEFGSAETEALLQWNQKIPETYLKDYTGNSMDNRLFHPTDWTNFYKISSDANWQADILPRLNQGTAYIKDPSTRLAPGLLHAQPGETILDLCAAPGGKAFDISHTMKHSGCIVAVDLPGNRILRLQQNLDSLRNPCLQTDIIERNILELAKQDFRERDLPTEFDGVMLDAPCSNTGVIQRRTDVKWRIVSKDISQCTQLQKSLLEAAAKFVKVGGRLVYSTCSIESAENQAVVDAFLNSTCGQSFQLEAAEISYPWRTGHDGAGAFRLRKIDADSVWK